MDWKITVAVIGFIFAAASYVPYWIDIFRGNTKPHLFTWIIWAISQGTALAGVIYGNGGFGSIALWAGMFGITSVLLLSFRYGTKNITRSDGIILGIAFLAIIAWWQLDNPLLAVLMVSAIDALGYLPTYRKLYSEPWSESLLSWTLVSIGYVFSILALTEHNLLTLSYLVTVLIANAILIALALSRRRALPKMP